MRPRRPDRGGRRWTFTPGEAPERPADPAVRRANLRRVTFLFKAYRRRLGAVLALRGNEREALRAAARRAAVERWSWGSVAGRILAIVE